MLRWLKIDWSTFARTLPWYPGFGPFGFQGLIEDGLLDEDNVRFVLLVPRRTGGRL